VNESSRYFGEKQVGLDVESSEILMRPCKLLHTLGLFVSEEVGEVLETKHHKAGKYVFACDPLDGSSVIYSSGNVEAIRGIHRVQGDAPCQSDFL
jgi:fructose-1,6-bisphosphatase